MVFSARKSLDRQRGLGSMGGDGQFLTELGDPNFSPSMGSQAQVPGAAAQARVFDNQRRAQNQIETAMYAGYDVSDPDWEPVHQQAETGFIQDAGNVIGTLGGWWDGMRTAGALLINDLLGGEAAAGFENPNFGDYWNALTGGMEKYDEIEERTGLSVSGSSGILDLFGWYEHEEDETFGRVTRGIADFGLQVLLDPLTYVTFGLSALGKKAALAVATDFQKAHVNTLLQAVKKGSDEGLSLYDKKLFSQMDEMTEKFSKRLRELEAEHGGALPKDMRDSFNAYFGREDAVWTNMQEAAIADQIGRDVMHPLMSRAFKHIDSLALEELPAWAKGGARISVPFTQGTLKYGVLIPGTQGLGRKLVGDPMRELSKGLKAHAPGYEYLADQVAKGVSKMDQMAPLTRALAAGDIEGWQWHIAATSVDNMHNNVAKHTIRTEINAHWNRLNDLAGAENIDLADVGADIFFRLEGDNISQGMLEQIGKLGDEAIQPSRPAGPLGADRLTPELRQAIDETVTYMQKTMKSYHEALSVLDPTFRDKFIKGYIPHMPSKSGRAILHALSGTTAGTAGTGDQRADLFAQMINASGTSGKAEGGMGSNMHKTRTVGRANVTRHMDDGALMVDRNALGQLSADEKVRVLADGVLNEDALELRYLPVPVLNRMLEPMVREAAAKHNIPLPKNWDGKIFNENPIETMLDYVENMADTIQVWSTVEALRASGLAFNHSVELDVQQVIQNMMGNLVANSARVTTVKAGRPVEGEVTDAPTDWLMKIVDPENAQQARDTLGKGPLDQSTWVTKQTDEATGFKDEALDGHLAVTDLKSGEVTLDRGAIHADWDNDLPYLRGRGEGDSANKARIFEELEVEVDELKERLDNIGGADAYEEFIMQHEQWHVANPNRTGYQAEKEATEKALKWVDTQPTHRFEMGNDAGGQRLSTTNPDEFKDSLAETGVRDAVVVEVYPDGMPQVANGHHRVVEGHAQGHSSIPVVFRRAVDESFRKENGVRIGDNLKSNWHDAGRSVSDAEDQLRRKARNQWTHTSDSIRPKIEQIVKGEVDPDTEGYETAAAMLRDFADNAEPVQGLKRDMNAAEVEEILGGDRTEFTFGMASSSPDDMFVNKARKGSKGQWIAEFPDDTRALRSDLSAYQEEEWFVHGRFAIESIDEEAGIIRFGRQDITDIDTSPGVKWDTTDSQGWEALDSTPWGPKIVEEVPGQRNLLHGPPEHQSRLPGVSRSVEMEIDKTEVMAWETLEDVAETRRLHRRLISTTEEEWASDVPNTPMEVSHEPPDGRPWHWQDHKYEDGTHIKVFSDSVGDDLADGSKEAAERAKRQAEQIKEAKKQRALAQKRGDEPPPVTMSIKGTTGPNDPPSLQIKFNPHATRGEIKAARRAAEHQLDREFKDGGMFAGMFNDTGIAQLVDSGMDQTTANVLRTYITHKMATLDHHALEFIAQEPAEVFLARGQFDNWQESISEFLTAYTAVTKDGRTIVDTEKVAILGTKEVKAQLAELNRAANELGDKGYDVAVKVMQGVDAYTGVQTMNGYVKPSHFNLQGPAVDNLTIQQDIAEWMSLTARNSAMMYTPQGVAAAKIAAKESLKWWRAMATLPRPAFHIRNLVGGSYMNMNYGVQTKTMAAVARWGPVYRKALADAHGQEGIEQAFAKLPPKIGRIFRAAVDNNVLAGFATTEFTDAITPAALRTRWGWAKAWDIDNFALTRAGGKVMETTEDFMRMSLFMQHYDEAVPGSAKFAAALVNQVHFNYSALTPTETKLKSFIPFFVWTRRNLPLQISLAVENPRYVQRYRAMMESLNENFGGNDDENMQAGDHFSAYAAGTNYRVNKNTPFWARVMIDPDLPIGDLLSIPNPDPAGLIEYANNILGPHISLIGDINNQREMGDVNAPAPFNAILQGLAAVGVYDRTMDGDVRIPYHLRTIMETALPWSREISDPLSGGATDPGRQQRMGIGEDDGFIESSLKALGGQLAGGFGVKLTTPTDTRSAAYRSDAELSEIIESLRLEGKAPLPPQR